MIKEGIININKPAGMTSHDCIYAVRRLVDIKRVGHTGTLDPNATGVLPICIGSCARIAEYTEIDIKEYDCTMTLGIVTDTQDIWGEVLLNERDELFAGRLAVTESDIRAAFSEFSGVIEQYPPKYSAVRYGGKRLYEYAREGRDIEMKSRRVYIESIDIKYIDLSLFTVNFSVRCGKGTYIRTICNDIGEKLGCGAVMSALTRTKSGSFEIADAVDFSYLKELTGKKGAPEFEELVNSLILPADYPLTAFGRAEIKTADRARWFVNGGHIKLTETDIKRWPKYKNEEPPFAIRREYKDAYCVYGKLSGDDGSVHSGSASLSERAEHGEVRSAENASLVFLGVAFYNYDYKKLVADKIFRRTDEGI